MNVNKFASALLILLLVACSGPAKQNPENWSDEQLNEWFSKGEWKMGWSAVPDENVNKKEFARQYFANKELWDKAFEYLKTAKLDTLKPGNYDIIGKDLYVAASEYMTKNDEDGKFEAHRKYADIQYVVSGKERIGITPLENTGELVPYDETKDIIFLSAEEGKFTEATPSKFYIFLPSDAHMPGMKIDTNTFVRKVVMKVRLK